MPSDEKPPRAERAQTDESLRVERAKTDRSIGDELTAVDDTADAVIEKARARADAVLAASRAKSDRHSALPSVLSIEGRRAVEDQAIHRERAAADETVRLERAEHSAVISAEREETDKDLHSERTRSDDALATRDIFLGIVSHDLRNMLNAILGFSELIADVVSKDTKLAQVLSHARRIQRSGSRMNRLIGDLVDVASIDAGALAVTADLLDPTQVVIEAVDTFQQQASAAGVSLSAKISECLPPVPLDSARILQVLVNLLTNALKFTAPGGAIVLRVDKHERGLVFAVTDSGTGIDASQLSAIFEPYVQAQKNDRRGVGLGLYISKCIVQGHGGKIWAESKRGEGSTFFFTLPAEVAG